MAFLGGLGALSGLAQGFAAQQQRNQQMQADQLRQRAVLMQLQDQQRQRQAMLAAGSVLGGPNNISGFPGSGAPNLAPLAALAGHGGGMPGGSAIPPPPTVSPGSGAGDGWPPAQMTIGGQPSYRVDNPSPPGGPAAPPSTGAPGAAPQSGPPQQPDPMVSQIFESLNPQQIARTIKAQRPDLPDDVVLMATQEIMKMGATGNKMEQAYALALMRETGMMQRHDTPSGSAELGAGVREQEGAANRSAAAGRQQTGLAAAAGRQQTGLAAAAGRQQTGLAAAADRQRTAIAAADARAKQRINASGASPQIKAQALTLWDQRRAISDQIAALQAQATATGGTPDVNALNRLYAQKRAIDDQIYKLHMSNPLLPTPSDLANPPPATPAPAAPNSPPSAPATQGAPAQGPLRLTIPAPPLSPAP